MYFKIEESPYNPGKYLIRLVHENLPLGVVYGSCNVLAARVCGLSWAEYLRMCRDIYGAELMGKNEKYPVAYFTDLVKAKQLVAALNKQVSTILKHKAKI
jgi:hypothetical protein